MYQINADLCSADRFIPNRSHQNFDLSHYYLQKSSYPSERTETRVKSTSKYFNLARSLWKMRSYEETLWSALDQKSNKVLNCYELKRKQPLYSVKNNSWPVHPRKQPLIQFVSTILDMPEFNSDFCSNVVDWSSKGFIACIFQQEVYLWNPENRLSYVITDTNRRVSKAVKWSKTSNLFAFSMKSQKIGIWNCAVNKLVKELICICAGRKECSVTSLCWSKDDWLISGCTRGRMCIWNNALELYITCEHAHSGTIITLTLSCAETYLASSSVEGIVRVWLWPELETNFEIQYNSVVRGIAWHPWKNPLMIAAGSHNNDITLCKANNEELIRLSLCGDFIIDGLTWNPLTAELVVSVWQENSKPESKILVMSDFGTVVDAIEWHTGRIIYLLWGNDGTSLGTVGSDETLCIWDFFGNAEMNKNALKRYQKKPKVFSLNPSETLFTFGANIR